MTITITIADEQGVVIDQDSIELVDDKVIHIYDETHSFLLLTLQTQPLTKE